MQCQARVLADLEHACIVDQPRGARERYAVVSENVNRAVVGQCYRGGGKLVATRIEVLSSQT